MNYIFTHKILILLVEVIKRNQVACVIHHPTAGALLSVEITIINSSFYTNYTHRSSWLDEFVMYRIKN